nr:MAG TPA: hypothetical protein [Bacteriophage sp.]
MRCFIFIRYFDSKTQNQLKIIQKKVDFEKLYRMIQ